MVLPRKAIFIFVGSLFLFILDRLFKYLAVQEVSWLVLFWNDRIAFSLPLVWSYVLSAGVVIILLLILRTGIRAFFSQHYIRSGWWLMLFLGALSNLYDRLVYSAVIDYFQLWTGFFNIADIMIGLGILYLVFIDSHDT